MVVGSSVLLLLQLAMSQAVVAKAFGAQAVPLGVAVEAAPVATFQLALADAQTGCFVR